MRLDTLWISFILDLSAQNPNITSDIHLSIYKNLHTLFYFNFFFYKFQEINFHGISQKQAPSLHVMNTKAVFLVDV